MKKIFPGKQLITVLLALGVAVGCATTPQEQPKAPASQANAVSQAIAAAKAAIGKAKSLGWIWRDTEKFLKKAEAAAAKGEDDVALKLAKKAKDQAELAVNQYYLEKAKVLLVEAANASGLTADQKATLKSAQAAILNAEGRKAYDLLSPLVAELRAATIQYEVVRGDSLWGIASRPDTYNNPYEWPLIFKANRDKIRDADLIYPGQVFSIDRNPSAAEVDAAIEHARTRGAWSIGVVEESDREYLGGSLQLK